VPASTISPVVRAILTADINLSADEVIKRAKAKGVTAPDTSIRYAAHNIKSELKKKGVKPTPAPAAARETKAPPASSKTPDVLTPVLTPSSAPDLSAMLANVALVNAVVGACGGVDQARKVAEAVRSCGSVEAFLQHLDLVAKVRGGTSM
jgi:hypothetical protein